MASLADREERFGQLAQAGWNIAALPAQTISADLSSDARAGRPAQLKLPQLTLDEAVEVILGFSFTIPAHLGRGAEAILSDLVSPGSLVLANEVYTTSAWLIRRRGGRIVDLPAAGRCAGDSDLSVLRDLLVQESVAWLHITLPRVLLGRKGGGNVTLANLKGIRELLDMLAPQVPLVLDASRIWENAARLPAEEKTGTLRADVQATCALADIVVLSGRKDAGGANAGLVAMRDPTLAHRFKQACLLLEGELDSGGTSELERNQLAQGLCVAHGDIEQRCLALEQTAQQLVAAGVPLVGWGAGSLFLDAQAWLPQVPAAQHPAQTLAALLFLQTGIRSLAHAVSEPGPAIVRLAVPQAMKSELLCCLPLLLDHARQQASGLRCIGKPPANGPFTEALEPVLASDWTQGRSCFIPKAFVEKPHKPVSSIDMLDVLPGELRKLFGLTDDWVILPAARERGPQSLLIEAWARLGGNVAAPDPLLKGLAAFWAVGNTATDGGCLRMTALGELDAVLANVRDEDSVAVDIGNWRTLLPPIPTLHPSWCRVRAWWSCTSAGGLLALRHDDPLIKAIRDASLYFAGDFRDGGLSSATCQKLHIRIRKALKD